MKIIQIKERNLSLTTNLLFRPNVAALIKVGPQYLGCIRTDLSGIQCMQGGIEKGEFPEDALHRELFEELGLLKGTYSIEHASKIWRRYRWPSGIKFREGPQHLGQEQKWYLIEVPEFSSIDLQRSQGEFCDLKLLTVSDLIQNIVSWKKPILSDFCFELGLL